MSYRHDYDISPQQQADQLVQEFFQHSRMTIAGGDSLFRHNAPKLALIAAQKVKKALPMYVGNLNGNWQYWDEVEKIIEQKINT